MHELFFVRDCGPDYWVALPGDFKEGDKVYEYIGHDYGCVRDDLVYCNTHTTACSLNYDEPPFFTVPNELLVDGDGNHPEAKYVKYKAAYPQNQGKVVNLK